jgi:hypothetical protein
MKHTIQSIAAALRGNPSSTECDELARACEPLRAERRARLLEITPTRGLPFADQPAGYREGILRDPHGPGHEREKLLGEIQQLEALESATSAAREAALNAEAAVAIPKARKKVPALVDKVRTTLAELKGAVADANAAFAVIGDYERLPGKQRPFNDDELAAILEVRNELWQPVHLQVPGVLSADPDGADAREFPRSWDLSYERIGPRDSPVITSRRPPTKSWHPGMYSDEEVIRVPYQGKRTA